MIEEIKQEIEQIKENPKPLNYFLKVFKRFAFECPIRDISDEFYKALVHY